MNIILGFGSTEKEFEAQEMKFCEDFINNKRNAFVGDSYDFLFKEELINELKHEIKNRKDEYDRLDAKYKNDPNFPERYSKITTFKVLNDLFDLCIIFDFGHTNRHHPMSPDGWAYLCTNEVYHIKAWK